MNKWGIIGIGRIGLSMTRNMSDKGISLSIYDKAFENKLDPIFEEKNLYPELKKVYVFNDILNFIESIESPRKILILVPSGNPNEQVISKLITLLNENDIIIDAGNTNPLISYSNKLKIAKNNILYLGIGVSGGTQGVLEGPSIMIGGDNSAFKKVKDDLFATVKFVAEVISVKKDKDNKIIEGNTDKIKFVTDVWKFTRNINNKSPNWYLAEIISQ